MELDDILACLDMSDSTFFRALRLHRETGNVERPKSTTRGRPRKLHFDDLTYMTALINHRPDWFLDELLGLLDTNRFISVHFTTIYRELERSGVSPKKLRRIAKERDEDLRADFVRIMGQYSAEEIGFLDEFSKDECTLHRRRGRAKKGKRAVMQGAFVRGRRVSGEGLLSLDGIVVSTVVEGSMTRDKFLYFLEHSVVSFVLFPLCYNPFTLLLDAPHFTIPRKVECPGDGQCAHSSWGRNFGACWEVWCAYNGPTWIT
jgi:transposase